MKWNRILALYLGMLMKCKHFLSRTAWDEEYSALTRTLIFCILVPLFICINYSCFSAECDLSTSSPLPSIFFLILWLIHLFSLISEKSFEESYQRSIKKVLNHVSDNCNQFNKNNKNETSSVPNEVSVTIEPENKSSANPFAPPLAPSLAPTAPPADPIFAI